jgi:hypothetical protein
MAFSHTLTRSFSSGSSTVSSSKTYTAGAEVNIDEALSASATDFAVAAAIDVSALQSLFLYCDVACTIEVNSTSSPTATIVLPAGEAYLWPNGSATNPLGGTDVTTLYCTIGSTAGTLQMRALVDPTP